MLVHTRLVEQPIVMKCPTDDALNVGDEIYLTFAEAAIHLFDRETKGRLRD